MRRAALVVPKNILTKEFFLDGKVPSKKNSKMITRGRLITKPEYQVRLKELTWQAWAEWGNMPPLTAACIDLHFHISTVRGDMDNKIGGLMDCLKDARVIVDDSFSHVRCILSTWQSVPKGKEGVTVKVSGEAA
jgi:Holliday junction resolvase RusA-like endonuclease